MSPTYDMDTATIARQHAEIMRQQRRIEDMRLELLKLVMDIQRVENYPLRHETLVLRLEEIRGEPA